MNKITGLAAVAAAILSFALSSAHAAAIWTTPRAAGGSYIFIKGEIVSGDEIQFIALNPPPPVFVRPSGPGGYVPTALAIGDTISQRGYSTIAALRDEIADSGKCASSCAIIWLSGYATHAIADITAMLGFHSCASNGQDDIACDVMIAQHLVQYGFTPAQAAALAYAMPHQGLRFGTLAWAQAMGIQPPQQIAAYPGAEGNCTSRFCVTVPAQPPYPAAYPPVYTQPYYPRPYYPAPYVRPYFPGPFVRPGWGGWRR